jgi:hypothetical protein
MAKGTEQHSVLVLGDPHGGNMGICGLEKEIGWKLTGGGADAVIERFFVAAGEGAEGFVADSEENDGDEGEEEGCC